MQILAHTKVSTLRYLMHTAKVKTDEPIMTDFKSDVEVLAFNRRSRLDITRQGSTFGIQRPRK